MLTDICSQKMFSHRLLSFLLKYQSDFVQIMFLLKNVVKSVLSRLYCWTVVLESLESLIFYKGI